MSRTLEGVKPGDKIKVRHQWSSNFDVYTVARVTKTRAVCACGTAFMIDSGSKVGTGSFTRGTWGSFATDEDFAQAALDSRIRDAQNSIRRMTVSTANLDAAEAFIAASKPEGT